MIGSPTSRETAFLFDVQRLALADGPGIRTNIFFKGCPLRCLWCHNPESYSGAPQLSFNSLLCVTCGLCADVCKLGVHQFLIDGGRVSHLVNHAQCSACGECLEVCCYDALEIAGRQYSADQVIEMLASDRPYFGLGDGGGITLTGGEPMAQWRFVEELAERLDGVHIAMETCGYADPETFLRLMPKIGLFLFDIKATDPEKHRRLCGVDNRRILENLQLLCDHGAHVVLRLPLISGVNDDDEHLREIARLMERFPSIAYAEVMPYHNLGESKRERFGMTTEKLELPSATEADKANWANKLKSYGVRELRIG